MTAFSVFAAARDAPPSSGVVFDGSLVSWSALAGQARAAMLTTPFIRATSDPDSVAAILARLAEGRPIALVHPRATETEAGRLRLSVEAVGLPRAPAVVLFTSGSTGCEKAVILPERALLASAAGSEAIFGWRPDDRWLLAMPLSHVGGLSVLLRCLRARSTVVLHRRFDPDAVLASIARDRVTLASLVPTMLHALLERDRHDVLPGLRAVLLGGAAASTALLAECAARRIAVHTTYGLTEGASQVTTQRSRPRGTTEPGTGEPLSGVRVTIHDASGALVAPGSDGRIRIAGPTLMDGYVGEAPLDGAFDTDDLGAFDERGRLFVYGRRSDRIVTGGENVDPLEVEQVLESCPAVARAFVFGVPDECWGEIVAVGVEAHGDPDAVLDQVREHLATMLASYKKPRRIAFTTELPRVLGGTKLDRARCRREITPRLRPLS